MKTIEVTIKGISGLLQNRFPEEDETTKVKKKSATSNDSDIEKSLYRLSDGTIYQPSSHIIGTLKAAGSKFRVKDQGKSTYKNIIGGGAVIIEPDCIPHVFQKWEINSRPVVNLTTRGRRIKKRPLFRDWSLSFKMIVDEEDLPIEVLKEVLDLAGRRVGIGDYRPQKGGPFGRFNISRFQVQ